MKKIIFLTLLYLTGINGFTQTKNFIDKPYLETVATVDTLVIPDQIYLSILITEKDTKGKTSVEDLENKMESKLTSLGIDTKKQLSLSDVSSNFKKYLIKSTDVWKNKAYTLVVYDAETAGKVIVGLESVDISNVHLTKTEYSKIEQLKIELKQRAIKKAKIQAESMLKPLNQTVGSAIFVSDLSTNPNISGFLAGSAAGIVVRGYSSVKRQSYEQTPIEIEFEKTKVESTVTVNFAIEQ